MLCFPFSRSLTLYVCMFLFVYILYFPSCVFLIAVESLSPLLLLLRCVCVCCYSVNVFAFHSALPTTTTATTAPTILCCCYSMWESILQFAIACLLLPLFSFSGVVFVYCCVFVVVVVLRQCFCCTNMHNNNNKPRRRNDERKVSARVHLKTFYGIEH